MAVHIPRWQTLGADAVTDSRPRRQRTRAGSGRDQVLILELLESRRLPTTGGGSQGVATGAGPDTNVWFTMDSNAIGMINPSNPVPRRHSIRHSHQWLGTGPIAAGPAEILYASDLNKAQIYKVDKTTALSSKPSP